jgi:hypothetical protein
MKQPPGKQKMETVMRTGWGVAATIAATSVMLAPTDQCIVTSVPNPQTQTRTFWVDEGKHRRLVTVVLSRSIT